MCVCLLTDPESCIFSMFISQYPPPCTPPLLNSVDILSVKELGNQQAHLCACGNTITRSFELKHHSDARFVFKIIILQPPNSVFHENDRISTVRGAGFRKDFCFLLSTFKLLFDVFLVLPFHFLFGCSTMMTSKTNRTKTHGKWRFNSPFCSRMLLGKQNAIC